ncbi:MAG: hypothetical protein ABEJ65_03070 [bacterium]
MEEDPVELIQDASNNISVLIDTVEDEDIIAELETTQELLSRAERSIEVSAEMDDMMTEYQENMEGLE